MTNETCPKCGSTMKLTDPALTNGTADAFWSCNCGFTEKVEDGLRRQLSAATERVEKAEEAADLDAQCIGKCREALKTRLCITAAFFDDCVGQAIRRVEKAEADLAAIRSERNVACKRFSQSESANMRLVKENGELLFFIHGSRDELAKKLLAMQADRDRLAGIVEKLPKTADGVPIVPGDEVWNEQGARLWWVLMLTSHIADVPDNKTTDGLYSTRAAVEAAKEAGKP
jgi:hypothetical protein